MDQVGSTEDKRARLKLNGMRNMDEILFIVKFSRDYTFNDIDALASVFFFLRSPERNKN